ncbi:hypothetical protein AB0C12_24920 [Actinoplanes sp. NPDC048967]|uniref:hypothetical protein n=1 Tax=Actinoplanes sp. NPDC048967 TaxID=3155269 RepID=UPI0033E98054
MSTSTTPFVLNKQPIDFPNLANGTAVKNAAKRFESAWSLPPEAAFALAAALVDPASERTAIDPKDVVGHLRAIQTPDGNFLLALSTRVWPALVSGDGGNGRSRYVIQTSAGNGVRPRPWPIGRHHKPAIIDYHPTSFDDMTAAVKLSAEEIRSQDLMTQIARNPRGVWNPPVVVLARAYIKLPGGGVKEFWFLHTIDGSTRVEACHELIDVSPTAPIQHSEAPLDFLRTTHARLIDKFNTIPTSPRSLAAARAATMPALIVVGVVEADGVTPISSGFPVVVNDYVESVHVQPRPFSEAAQSNVIGERFVLTLEKEGWLNEDESRAILGREPDVGGKPSMRAATLVEAVTAGANDALVRDFVITEDGARLTKVKRARLIGPLVVRQFEDPAATAERALMRAFTPDRLLWEWELTGVDSDTLREQCLNDLDNGQAEVSNRIAELMARGGPALCAAGLLLSDQESTVRGIKELRGGVDKVVEALAKTAGGINVLADAVAWADGEMLERPRQFDIEGTPKKDGNGDQLHYSTPWWEGNMRVRALAFIADGELPKPTDKNDTPDDDTPKSPEEDYRYKEQRLIENLIAARQRLLDMAAAVDDQQRKLMPRLRLSKKDIYTKLPPLLTQLYAKYGPEDVLDALGEEDDLPDVGAPTVQDDTEDDE